MTLTVEITFECLGEREATSLEAALSPDNKSIPKDQRFSSERSGSVLRFKISSPRPASCISSALSLLSDARLFQEVWSAAS
jgi:hypothetical protein